MFSQKPSDGGVVSLFLFPLLLRRPSGWGDGSARVEAPIWKLLLVGRLKIKKQTLFDVIIQLLFMEDSDFKAGTNKGHGPAWVVCRVV